MYQGVLIGILATVMLDVWAWVVKHGLKLPTANWALVGRWIAYMPKGQFFHRPVADSTPLRHELAIGWTAHYLIGAVYGLVYLAIVRGVLVTEPTLLSALIFALVTLAAPWLIMQPGMGAGVFASKTPRPNITRLVNLSMHLVYGLGLYLAWRLLQLNS